VRPKKQNKNFNPEEAFRLGAALELVWMASAPNLKAASVLGDFEMFFAQGNTFAGVHAAKSKPAAQALSEKLAATIREKQK
jgi:predicted DNA-binding transcriptional regulator YafY